MAHQQQTPANDKHDKGGGTSKPIPPMHVVIDPSPAVEHLKAIADNSKNQTEEKPLPRFIRPEWVIVYITAIYSLIAGFTLWAIKRQADTMEDQTNASNASARAAEKAADAARESADGLKDAERAWLLIGPSMDSFRLVEDAEPCFIWFIKNCGRSPARILETQCIYELVYQTKLTTLPLVPQFDKPISLNELVLVPDDSMSFPIRLTRIDENGQISLGVLDRQTCGTIKAEIYKLRVYGFVKYLDIFGKIRESRFCHFYLANEEPLYKARFHPLLEIPPAYTKYT